jgi:hypothetical protein
MKRAAIRRPAMVDGIRPRHDATRRGIRSTLDGVGVTSEK